MNMPAGWTTLPLTDAGRSLVEASAGTGKTWTIAVLYLRLLLEQQRMPSQIIVSTFTKAAAAELAERLRGKLLWALAEAEHHCCDEVLDDCHHADRQWLHGRWQASPATLVSDVLRLQAALTEFDIAPISTLHALCSRILADHPFAAGALFKGRTIVDDTALTRELARDLWRVITQQNSAVDTDVELARLGQQAGITRETLKKYLPVLVQPDVVFTATGPALDVPDLVKQCPFLQDIDAWVAKTRTIAEAHADGRSKLKKAWLALANALLDPVQHAAALAGFIAVLQSAHAQNAIKKSGENDPEVSALLDQTERIAHLLSIEALDLHEKQPLRQFLAAAQDWCCRAMQARLEAANQSTFEQLVSSVHQALVKSENSRTLADALFAAWPVALVDEFQDTDPVQFGILDAIYRDADGAFRGRLVMIGDPKQAIYRFRGGDVQAYERAKADVAKEDRLTLETNHRSSRGYVGALNAFYQETGERLGPSTSSTKIVYQAVQASARRDAEPLGEGPERKLVSEPLVLHELDAEDPSRDLEDLALRNCAQKIIWALSDAGYRKGHKRLQPGDIAVLLPSNHQVIKQADLLKALGVPCVVGSQSNVFATDTARELRMVMHAVLHADQPGVLRAALATRLLGMRWGQLQALRHDPAAWDAQTQHFHALHQILQERGPLAVVAQLLELHAARLLASVPGERILTDLRHLGELLQDAWVSCGTGERLLAWFADQMDEEAAKDAAEARALRLESDAERVKVMTMHASKGLEFDVVFLPLMWKHGHSKNAWRRAMLLNAADGHGKILIEGAAKSKVEQQAFEEHYRILYVVLTRAIHACHLWVLPQSNAVTKAIKDAKNAKGVPLNALSLFKLWKDEPQQALAGIAHRQGWNVEMEARWSPMAESGRPRVLRSMPVPPAGPLPMRHSFTTLTSAGHHRGLDEGNSAEDEALVEMQRPAAIRADNSAPTLLSAAEVAPALFAVTRHAELDALSPVVGADFGNAVHTIFEHRLPGISLLSQQARIRRALEEHGVLGQVEDPQELVTSLAVRLQAVLETRLGGVDGPRLCDLTAQDMRAELEFNYLLDGVSLRLLRKACEAHGEPELVPAHDQVLAGLMNGKIDLVFAHGGRFHVLDYKGNHLAKHMPSCLEDYAPDAVADKMHRAGYRFQALLYTVAVERYLRERLGAMYRREQHLGECWYLFIRAVGLYLPDGTACGVWRHRFGDALLDAVQQALGAVQQEAA